MNLLERLQGKRLGEDLEQSIQLDMGDPAKMRWKYKLKEQKKITMDDEEKMRHLYN